MSTISRPAAVSLLLIAALVFAGGATPAANNPCCCRERSAGPPENCLRCVAAVARSSCCGKRLASDDGAPAAHAKYDSCHCHDGAEPTAAPPVRRAPGAHEVATSGAPPFVLAAIDERIVGTAALARSPSADAPSLQRLLCVWRL